MDLKAPRGTFDILPDDAKKRSYIENAALEIFESFGYRKIATPIFENTELFQRGIGESTDIVQKEMYTFIDKGGRSLTLRPEGTAPVVRAFIEHNMNGWTMPVKLYYSGQMYRYERPQAGRYREFWQIGVEAMGSNDPALDAETIILLVFFLHHLGLTDLDVLINSMGCSSCRAGYSEGLKRFLVSEASRLCDDCQKRSKTNPLRIFDCKSEICHKAIFSAPKIDEFWCQACRDHFSLVQSYLNAVGLEFKHDAKLVRGFDYYTKTTFEVQSKNLGAQNALGGGGRYDDLISAYGGPRMPGIGFAVGVDRILLALDAAKVKLPEYAGPSVYLAAFDDAAKETAFQLLFDLRNNAIAAEMDYMGRSFKGQLKQADKQGAEYTIVLGPDELAQSSVTLKNMETGQQGLVKISRVVNEVRDRLRL